ncbi:2-oxo-4-hydroxy-4-carboxy-5-ureidoimidazoline decarboxylase [Nesterenkonia sp. PF2B19]|uniref:2-oxo-4-hydroxy-4-carboxy-5-ureidoimidazoline decarboxylase n=1 Tax=Nesterenkonia sp. PF2B19 TaxID=1881858 RepID=UPI00301516E9
MSLTEFNRAADGDARAQLQSCLRVSRWVDGLSARRPFSSVEEALELAHTIAHPLTEEEIDERSPVTLGSATVTTPTRPKQPTRDESRAG